MIDRVTNAAPGVLGGAPGAPGDLVLSSGERPIPKTQVTVDAHQRVRLNLPGGGGRGDPYQRATARVLADVIAGYVTPDAARRDYGVMIECHAPPDTLVRLPEDFRVDEPATRLLRQPLDRADSNRPDLARKANV
jgi:N-methylhydantoinase B